MSSLRPLNLKKLLPGRDDHEAEGTFQEIVFPDAASHEEAARAALEVVRECVGDWYSDPANPAVRQALVTEVECVIRVLQSWVQLFGQSVIFPENIAKYKDMMAVISDTDQKTLEELYRNIRLEMGKIKISPVDYQKIREEDVYLDESAMAQMTRNAKTED